jgi:hypothetical protein
MRIDLRQLGRRDRGVGAAADICCAVESQTRNHSVIFSEPCSASFAAQCFAPQ